MLWSWVKNTRQGLLSQPSLLTCHFPSLGYRFFTSSGMVLSFWPSWAFSTNHVWFTMATHLQRKLLNLSFSRCSHRLAYGTFGWPGRIIHALPLRLKTILSASHSPHTQHVLLVETVGLQTLEDHGVDTDFRDLSMASTSCHTRCAQARE